jgi:serine/threonine-protein kinase RsbT
MRTKWIDEGDSNRGNYRHGNHFRGGPGASSDFVHPGMKKQATERRDNASPAIEDEVQTEINSAHDVLTARQMGRYRAIALGIQSPDVTLLAAAISEVARNIIDHAKAGEIIMRIVRAGGRRGLKIIARDRGPGIPDVLQATQYGASPRRALGVGLPGAKLLVDEFDIISGAGCGTTVTMTKWAPA